MTSQFGDNWTLIVPCKLVDESLLVAVPITIVVKIVQFMTIKFNGFKRFLFHFWGFHSNELVNSWISFKFRVNHAANFNWNNSSHII